ncbi:MAG: 50S ribosomal protein L24 [Clostridia bacterium]|nr:50S ribosomal protein L24 [Clostridia bacterium]
MNNLHVKKGDNVMIIAGKDKGKSGSVTKVDVENGRVLVEGMNIATNYVKPRNAQEKGGIVKKEAPINASNVMIICPTCGKATRVGHRVETIDGKQVKIRFCKKCNESLEKKVTKVAKKAAAKKTSTKKSTTKKTAEAAVDAEKAE